MSGATWPSWFWRWGRAGGLGEDGAGREVSLWTAESGELKLRVWRGDFLT